MGRKFTEEWAKMVNEEGGIFVKEFNAKLPVELLLFDDGSNADRAVEFYEKMGTVDKVDIFLGPASSPITIRASTVAERLGIPMVGSEANSPTVYARGLKWIVGVDRIAPLWSELYFQMLKKQIEDKVVDLKTIAFVVEDTPHTKDIGDGAQDLAKKIGLKVVGVEIVPPGTKDFAGVIGKLKGLNPDIVYISAWIANATAFVKQAYELGLDPKEFHVSHATIGGPGFIKDVGEKLANGITAESHEAPFKKGDVKRFRALQKRAGMKDPLDYGWSSIRFLALETIRHAIEKAGTLDKAKLMETLKGLRFEGLHGDVYFQFGTKYKGKTLNGHGTKLVYPTQIQKGKVVVIWPADMATGKFQPRAKWR
jgi:branched-chain amino acid transport system substrate-binding protein